MRVLVAPLLKQQVGATARFEVAEDPIDPRGECAALLEAGARSIDASIEATHTDPGILLEGSATVLVAGQCSRCLKDCLSRVTTQFAEQYYLTVDLANGAPRLAPPADSKTIDSDFRIDLSELLAEEIIIVTPFAPLCREDCKGLCLECGADLNLGPHGHDAAPDARWAALRKLEGFHPGDG